jgi:GLPGLI family protein
MMGCSLKLNHQIIIPSLFVFKMCNMKGVLCVIAMLMGINTFSQKQLQITYENNSFCFSNVKESKIKVVAADNICLSTNEDHFEIKTYTFSSSTGESRVDTEIELLMYHVYKNYQKNTLYSFDDEYFECYLKENMVDFEWRLGEEKKDILGYKCNQARSHFRGREYTAWFTTELPFKAAPWKFYGLPGVILEVTSKENVVLMRAIELKVTDGKCPKNPFEGKEFLTWDGFATLYKERYRQNQKSLDATQARLGLPTMKINRPRIEIIIDANHLNLELKQNWDGRAKGFEKNQ